MLEFLSFHCGGCFDATVFDVTLVVCYCLFGCRVVIRLVVFTLRVVVACYRFGGLGCGCWMVWFVFCLLFLIVAVVCFGVIVAWLGVWCALLLVLAGVGLVCLLP